MKLLAPYWIIAFSASTLIVDPVCLQEMAAAKASASRFKDAYSTFLVAAVASENRWLKTDTDRILDAAKHVDEAIQSIEQNRSEHNEELILLFDVMTNLMFAKTYLVRIHDAIRNDPALPGMHLSLIHACTDIFEREFMASVRACIRCSFHSGIRAAVSSDAQLGALAFLVIMATLGSVLMAKCL